MSLYDALEELAEALAPPLRPRWALVGGLAVTIRAEPRFTADLDIAVTVRDDAQAEALVRALLSRGWSLGSVMEHERLERLAGARMRIGPPAHVDVDLLFAASGFEDRIVDDATLEPVGRHHVPVARVGHLVVMKLLSVGPGRMKDRVDLEALAPQLTPEEVARARQAVTCLVQRGAHRGRDLSAALETYLSTYG